MAFVLPQVQLLLNQLRLQMGDQPKLRELPVSLARSMFRELVAMLDSQPPCVRTEDHDIGGVPCRVYRPSDAEAGRALIYYHGGGFVMGDMQTTHGIAGVISNVLKAVTVSVDYRLAPEHPFPAAYEDCHSVAQAVLDGSSGLGAFSRILVGGDSAGGTLAASAAQRFRNCIAGQLLLYPATDFTATGGSMEEFATGFFLEKEDIDWFSNAFMPGTTDLCDPRLSPIFGDLTALPPAVVVTAELDPLRDQGVSYVNAIRATGTKVVHIQMRGMVHGCFNMRGALPAAQAALVEAVTVLLRAVN